MKATMHRKQYQIIATAIREADIKEEERMILAEHFASVLGNTNERFSPDRFIRWSTDK